MLLTFGDFDNFSAGKDCSNQKHEKILQPDRNSFPESKRRNDIAVWLVPTIIVILNVLFFCCLIIGPFYRNFIAKT